MPKHHKSKYDVSEIITQDIVTVISPFLQYDDLLKCIRISKSWFRAIQSNQNFWRDQVLIGILKVDQIMGLQQVVAEFWEANPNSDQEDWMKIVQMQFLKLPKKVAVRKRGKLQKLDAKNYGNVDVIKTWKPPFKQFGKKIEEFEEEISIFEFSFDIRKQLEKIVDLDEKKKRLTAIYACCFFYEMLTVGNYVPNLYTDLIKIYPISSLFDANLEKILMYEPFPFILLAILQSSDDDFEKFFLEYFHERLSAQFRQFPETPIYSNMSPNVRITTFTPDMILESGINNVNFAPNVNSAGKWMLLDLFRNSIGYAFKLGSDEDWKKGIIPTGLVDSTFLNGLYPMYYNAGGNYYDIVKVSFSVDKANSKKVIITRQESVIFY